MIIKENVTLFCCEHCKKELKRKHSMEKHEKICDKNPVNMSHCYSCKFLNGIEKEVSFEIYFGDGETDYVNKKVNVFHCSKFDKFMYPYSIERKGLPDRFPSTYDEQEPMPKLGMCEEFRFYGINYKEDINAL